jgi:polar amino acid transport system substrate-binding protein
MRTTHWVIAAILGLLLTGCAGISTAPTPEARQALARPASFALRSSLAIL